MYCNGGDDDDFGCCLLLISALLVLIFPTATARNASSSGLILRFHNRKWLLSMGMFHGIFCYSGKIGGGWGV